MLGTHQYSFQISLGSDTNYSLKAKSKANGVNAYIKTLQNKHIIVKIYIMQLG